MYFKQFLHDDFGCSSYHIASRESREAAVIDPHRDVQQYLDLAAERVPVALVRGQASVLPSLHSSLHIRHVGESHLLE